MLEPTAMPAEPVLTPAKRDVLACLKRSGPLSAAALAEALGVSDVAARQHLAALESVGYVRSEAPDPAAPRGRGRPSATWAITDRATALFPDHHGELAVGLIDAIRASVGEAGLRRIVEVRARDQVNLYRAEIPTASSTSASLKRRVEALAARRSAEGYMAEVVREAPGVYLLIEHHCPICDAARACTGLCSAELRVFRETLGDDVEVERTAHLLADGDRCVYRIRRSA